MQTFVDSDGKLTITLPPVQKEDKKNESEEQEEDEEAEEQEEDEKTEEEEVEEAEEEDIEHEMKHAEPPQKKQWERNNSNVRKPKSYYGPTSIEPATSTFETTFKFDAQPATFNFGYDPSAFNFTPSFKFEETQPVQAPTPVQVPVVAAPVPVVPVAAEQVPPIPVEIPIPAVPTVAKVPVDTQPVDSQPVTSNVTVVTTQDPVDTDCVSESDISSDSDEEEYEEDEEKPDLQGVELRNISDMVGSLNLKISALLLHRPQFGAQHAISMLISLGVGYLYGLSTVYRPGYTGSFSNYH